MTLAEVKQPETPPARSASAVRAAGRRAASRLAEAERLRAAAIADLVEYHDGHGPIIERAEGLLERRCECFVAFATPGGC